MSGKEDTGSKTELPTPKKLREARKKGDVPKSQDLVTTAGFLFALLLIWLLAENIGTSLTALFHASLDTPGKPFLGALTQLGDQAISVFITVSALILIPLVLLSLTVDFLQTGPVMTTEKIKPQLSHLSPVEGLKRMFGANNLVELIKSVFKTGILFAITFFTIKAVVGDLILLARGEPNHIMVAIWHMVVRIVGLTAAAYILITILDVAYQKHSFTKRMKMSLRGIRDELKESEGDPMLREERNELGREWAQETPVQAAQQANVLIVNPVHVAIAISYDRVTTPVLKVTGKGREAVALEMRRAAMLAGVPVLRNEQLARSLLSDKTEENLVPRELFDIMAEVILWAKSARQNIQHNSPEQAEKLAPPGEDLSTYY